MKYNVNKKEMGYFLEVLSRREELKSKSSQKILLKDTSIWAIRKGGEDSYPLTIVQGGEFCKIFMAKVISELTRIWLKEANYINKGNLYYSHSLPLLIGRTEKRAKEGTSLVIENLNHRGVKIVWIQNDIK